MNSLFTRKVFRKVNKFKNPLCIRVSIEMSLFRIQDQKLASSRNVKFKFIAPKKEQSKRKVTITV